MWAGHEIHGMFKAYSFETKFNQDNSGEENASGLSNNGRRNGRRLQKSVFPNKRRSISIGQGKGDNSRAHRLSRTSINLKEQIDHNKALFTKSSSNQKLLPNEDLDQLCNQCLNLLRQNKISSKNAFEILLIDHLNEILNVQDENGDRNQNGARRENTQDIHVDEQIKKRNPDTLKNLETESPNKELEPTAVSQDSNFHKFQRAAVTLEASARIYGYRVDSTFDNAYRILSNIKSGQILARNNSEGDEDENQQNGDSDDSTGGGEAEIDKRKKTNRKNLVFSKESSTIASTPESITIKDFDKTKEASEKPFFANYLNDEVKLDGIRLGVDCGNIGSISSMLMSNLELRDLENPNGDGSISLSFNISGKSNRNIFRRHNSFGSRFCSDQLLKVNKEALDVMMQGQDDFSSSEAPTVAVCPELSKILDSIRTISETYGNLNKQVKDSIVIEECFADLKSKNRGYLEFSESEVEGHILQPTEQNLDLDKRVSLDTNECREETTGFEIGIQNFQTHVEKVIEDLNRSELPEKQNFEEALDQSQEIEIGHTLGVEERRERPQYFCFSSKIGDILDFLSRKSARNGEFFRETKKRERDHFGHGQRPKSNPELVVFEVPIPLLTNKVFNGIEWINSLAKIKQTQTSSSKVRTRGSSSNKIFVGESNTSSIFNYNLNHLFCLANLTGIKINLRSIHGAEESEERMDELDSTTENELLIKTNHYCGDTTLLDESASGQTDLMVTHTEIEQLMQTEGYFQSLLPGQEDSYPVESSKELLIQSRLILPFEDKASDADALLEKSSKSLHVRDEYNHSLKLSKLSNHIDIDIVKGALKSSIQQLTCEDSNSLNLSNIINQSVSLPRVKKLHGILLLIIFKPSLINFAFVSPLS